MPLPLANGVTTTIKSINLPQPMREGKNMHPKAQLFSFLGMGDQGRVGRAWGFWEFGVPHVFHLVPSFSHHVLNGYLLCFRGFQCVPNSTTLYPICFS